MTAYAHLEENAFATSHPLANVYGRAEKRCGIRSEDTAVDAQIHADGLVAKEAAEMQEGNHD
jgi:hypothetical protein